jgi:hypothetical protein
MQVTPNAVTGDILEIFPTLFMAALLPPSPYCGRRNRHTDDLWSSLLGQKAPNTSGHAVQPLRPYSNLIKAIAARPRRDQHELRAAAVSAIAADWCAQAGPGTGAGTATTFFGHPAEYGFIMPPRAWCDQQFLAMLDAHWASSKLAGQLMRL